MLNECHKLRNVGAERSTTKELTIRDHARIMWGALVTMKLTKEIIDHDFDGHPKMAGYALSHLFRNRCSPKLVGDLKTQVSALKKVVDSNKNKIDTLKPKKAKKKGGKKDEGGDSDDE